MIQQRGTCPSPRIVRAVRCLFSLVFLNVHCRGASPKPRSQLHQYTLAILQDGQQITDEERRSAIDAWDTTCAAWEAAVCALERSNCSSADATVTDVDVVDKCCPSFTSAKQRWCPETRLADARCVSLALLDGLWKDSGRYWL